VIAVTLLFALIRIEKDSYNTSSEKNQHKLYVQQYCRPQQKRSPRLEVDVLRQQLVNTLRNKKAKRPYTHS